MKTKKSDTGKNNGQPADEPDPRQEKAGYGRPPKEHAIKPGEVRNPWGRYGKPQSEGEFLEEYVVVIVNNKRKKITRRRALKESMFRAGMGGSIAATRHLERSAERRAAKAQGADEAILSGEEEQILERYLERETERRLRKKAKK